MREGFVWSANMRNMRGDRLRPSMLFSGAQCKYRLAPAKHGTLSASAPEEEN